MGCVVCIMDYGSGSTVQSVGKGLKADGNQKLTSKYLERGV